MDTDADLTAYLARIGLASAPEPSAQNLSALVAAHVETVPFENLSVHLREPIDLTPDALFDKIVRRRRGGFCYELNSAFVDVLTALGFDATTVGCRVHGPEGPTFVLDHAAVLVALGGRRLLVDVGFGRFARSALDLDVTGPQPDVDGEYTMAPTPEGDVDVLRDATAQYRLEPRARTRTDMRPGAWYHWSSPESPFTQSLTCSRTDGDGRVTLAGSQLIRTSGDGTRKEETLGSGALLGAYREWFGIELDEVPTVLYPRSEC